MGISRQNPVMMQKIVQNFKGTPPGNSRFVVKGFMKPIIVPELGPDFKKKKGHCGDIVRFPRKI